MRWNHFESSNIFSRDFGIYSCDKITTTQIQISHQNWNYFFSYISHQMMILLDQIVSRAKSKLVRWITGTNDSSTKCLMFQVSFFFTFSCKIHWKNNFNLLFCFLWIYKYRNKSFDCLRSIRIFIRNYEKNNAWNNRRLVDDKFVQWTQRPSVLYCKLTDF